MFALRCRGRPVLICILTCVVADEFARSAGEALCVSSTLRYCTQREMAVDDVLLSYRLVMGMPRSQLLQKIISTFQHPFYGLF